MTPLNQLVHIVTRLSVLSPWEACALTLIEENQPSSVSFICDDSGERCPVNDLYKELQVPSQTFFGLETNNFSLFLHQDMVFIIDDNLIEWSEQAVEKYRRGGKNDFTMVIVANKNAAEYDFKSMDDIFGALWLSGIVRCAVLLVNDTSSELYTYIPFKNSSSCEDTTPVLIGECSNGAEKVFDLAFKVYNFNRCPLRIGVLDEYRGIFGRSSPLLKEIISRMNASAEMWLPIGGAGGVCGKEEQTGLRGMTYNGTVHMGYASFQQKECSTLEYVGMGYTACWSWCTPVLSANDYVYSFLLKQLQLKVWLSLIMSVLAVSGGVVILCAVSHEEWTASDIFMLSVSIYAQLPPLKLRGTLTRVVAGIWLWASVVLRAAYEGEMKSQSAVHLDTHIIEDVGELADSSLMLCTTFASLQILQGTDSPVIQRLLRKTRVCKKSIFENIETAALLKDRAVFTQTGVCLEAVSALGPEKVLQLYPRTGGCFLVKEITPIVTVRGSPFKAKWAEIMKRCFQAGLISKWRHRQPPSRNRSGAILFTVAHLLPALFVLGLGCFGGLVLFVGEKMYHRCSYN